MRDCAPPPKQGLYDPGYEHDACGIGFLAHIKNRKSHDIIRGALGILCNLRHRGAVGADPLAGRRIRHPDPNARCVPARRMRPTRLRVACSRRVMRSGWCSFRATARLGRHASTLSRPSS